VDRGIDSHAGLSSNREESLPLTRGQLKTIQRLIGMLNYTFAKRRHGNHAAERLLKHFQRH
jgi:hypothetical protein